MHNVSRAYKHCWCFRVVSLVTGHTMEWKMELADSVCQNASPSFVANCGWLISYHFARATTQYLTNVLQAFLSSGWCRNWGFEVHQCVEKCLWENHQQVHISVSGVLGNYNCCWLPWSFCLPLVSRVSVGVCTVAVLEPAAPQTGKEENFKIKVKWGRPTPAMAKPAEGVKE